MIFLAVLCLSFLSVEAFDSCCNCRRPHMVMSTMLHIYREVDPGELLNFLIFNLFTCFDFCNYWEIYVLLFFQSCTKMERHA